MMGSTAMPATPANAVATSVKSDAGASLNAGLAAAPHIDFAVNAPDRLLMACRIVRKHYLQRRRIAVFSSDAARLAAFDLALWQFAPLAFIPHVAATHPLAEHTPVLLGNVCAQLPQTELLLNLDDSIPNGFERYAHLVEVVGRDDEERRLGRLRFKHYRDHGIAVQVHDMAHSA